MTIRFIFICGKTGGHIYPAIALAQQYNFSESLFIGDDIVKKIVSRYGYGCKTISVSRSIVSIFKAYCKFYQFLKKNKVCFVIATGSYTTIPFILAAYARRIPVILMEQNLIPGRTNRLMSLCAKKVCTSFEESRGYFIKKSNILFTGNPIRSRYPSSHDTFLDSFLDNENQEQPIITLFGGSQGAQFISDLFIENRNFWLKQPYRYLVLTGERWFSHHYSGCSYKQISTEQFKNKALIMPYYENMEQIYLFSNLIISRSGATTLAELMHYTKSAILIPYPYAKDNHQYYNAEYFCTYYLGRIIKQNDCSLELIRSYIEILLSDEKLAVDKSSQNLNVSAANNIKNYLDAIL